MSRDDHELLDRSADGDRAAFESFVSSHADAVFRFLRVHTESEADAEDALQEVFMAAWRGAAGFRGGSGRAWVLTIARNAAHRLYRRRVGEPAHFVDLESTEVLGLRAGWGQPDGGQEDDVDVLRRAFERLSSEDREILALRELEGFSGEETADVLGLSLAAMKSRLHRARLRLTAAVREAGDD